MLFYFKNLCSENMSAIMFDCYHLIITEEK